MKSSSKIGIKFTQQVDIKNCSYYNSVYIISTCGFCKNVHDPICYEIFVYYFLKSKWIYQRL